jgi:V-ATPase subunit C
LKVIRAYAESILRYGVPADRPPRYLTMFVTPNEKLEKQTMDSLTSFVAAKLPQLGAVEEEVEGESDVDCLPYVFQKFNLVGTKKLS